MHLCLLTSSYPTAPDDLALPFLPHLVAAVAARGHRVTVLSPDRRPRRSPAQHEPPTTPTARNPDDVDRHPDADVDRHPNRDDVGRRDGPRVVWFHWHGARRPVVSLDPRRPRDVLIAAHLCAAAYATATAVHIRQPIDHLLALFAVPAGAVALALAAVERIPYSVWALGSDVLVWGRRPAGAAVLRAVLRQANHRFADGQALTDQVAAIAGRPCRLLPTARPLPPPAPVAVDRSRRNLLFLGRLERVKGIDVLLDAFGRAAVRHHDLDLHVVGDGSLASLARATAAGAIAGRIHLHGTAGPAAVAGFLAACDALVLPSRSESIPTALVEAAAAGLPTIASSVGDVPRLVHAHALGALVPPDDPSALAAAIDRWAATPPARLPAATAAAIRAAFSPEAAADRLLSAIELPSDP